MAGIVDFRSFVPTENCMRSIVSPPDDLERYSNKYGLSSFGDLVMTPEQLINRLDSNQIDHMVLAGLGVTIDEISEYVSDHPSRLSGVAGVSPENGIGKSISEIRRAYRLGFRMVGIRPFRDEILSCDRRYYPIYAACAEQDMAIVIHTSFNFGRGLIEFGHPKYLDQVASDFAELVIIASHGGWPWVREMVAVAWHNENIFVEISAQKANHMARAGSGWEALFNYGSGPLRERLLWGSASPFLNLERQVAESRGIPLTSEAVQMMLEVNPRAVLSRLGIEPFSSSNSMSRAAAGIAD